MEVIKEIINKRNKRNKRNFSSVSNDCQPLIHLEEAGDAIGFGETFDGEAVV